MLELQKELQEQIYQPGKYHSFYIHEPKRRLISAAPFRDRWFTMRLSLTTPHFEKRFIPNSFANRVGKGTHRALDACQQLARRILMFCNVMSGNFFRALTMPFCASNCKMLPDGSLFWLIDRLLASGAGVLSEEYQMVYFMGMIYLLQAVRVVCLLATLLRSGGQTVI